MKKNFLLHILFMGVLILTGCEKDEPETVIRPSISFENTEGIFDVKVGRSIKIEPTINDAIDPFYIWRLNGEIVSREASYEFLSKKVEQYNLTFQVNAANGNIEHDIKINVLELTPPKIEIPLEDGYVRAIIGRELEIIPNVTHSESATYEWVLNRAVVSTEPTYTFKQDELGDYNLVLTVTNEDGQGRSEAIVRVGEIPQLSFFFENEKMTVPLGRKAVIAPYVGYSSATTKYTWEVDGTTQQETGEMLTFTPSAIGSYTIKVTGTGSENTTSATITLNCVAAEGTYFRAATASSSPTTYNVLEFLPAPGQYTNEGYSPASQQEANDYASQRLQSGNFISLGGFGGYVIVKFDHSVENRDGKNLAIKGNALSTSSEPGIVWVMQDENGNGLADDTWYELKGSESGKVTTRKRHTVTYFKPTANRQDVRWIDNNGGSGKVDINSFHSQNSYYPVWITAASYTLRGTCLAPNSYDTSGNETYWVNENYDWGYADNYGQDYIGNETQLDISNAIYPDGSPADIKYIDFVKVHTGVNAKAGWLGEISTEVFGFRDMN